MPAIPIPYDRGTAVVLTDACLVVTSSNGVFGHPHVVMSNGSSVFLTAAEFGSSSINWRRIVMARFGGLFGVHTVVGISCKIFIRVSIYGVDLSERLRGVSSICMVFTGRGPADILGSTFINLAVPRMAWLARYRMLVERRLALAMAGHRRLGADSSLLLRILSSNSDVVFFFWGGGLM